ISVDYGDTIKVTAICNIAGSITDQTVVQTPTSPPNTETSDASSIILLGVSMLALVLVVGIKKR
ncbi:MAG: LPXTG cell wall anchor domain-containing protein, partial [Candidatus Heimdallarchaeaceae archaeon]